MRPCGAILPLALVSGDPRRPKYTAIRCNRPEHQDGQHSWSTNVSPRLIRWLDEPAQFVATIRKGVKHLG